MNSNTKSNTPKYVFYIALFSALVLTFVGFAIMSQIGQFMNLSRDTFIGYFNNRNWLSIVSILLLGVAVFLQLKHRVAKRLVFIAPILLSLFFLTMSRYQNTHFSFAPVNADESSFVNVDEAGKILKDDDVVVVLQLNNEIKAYPIKVLWQPHIVNNNVGGEDVTLTYCILTNSACVYQPYLNEQKMDLKVIGQVNNNLVLYDEESGKIIQQLFNTTIDNDEPLTTHPVREMPFASLKKLYPEADVLMVGYTTLIGKIMSKNFDERDYLSNDTWIYNTLNLEDSRLESKEKIVGINYNGEAVAVSHEFLKNVEIYQVEVSDRNYVLHYSKEYNTISTYTTPAAFDTSVEITEIDMEGNTPFGKLERAHVFNSPFWGVWVHFLPNTKLIK